MLGTLNLSFLDSKLCLGSIFVIDIPFFSIFSNVVGIAADSWLTIMDRFLILGDENAEEKAEMKKKMLKLTDIYYDALDAPKKGAKVYLSDELKPDIFPHYMERDQKFKSTSILGMIYDFVKSQTADEHRPSSGNGPLLLVTILMIRTYKQIITSS